MDKELGKLGLIYESMLIESPDTIETSDGKIISYDDDHYQITAYVDESGNFMASSEIVGHEDMEHFIRALDNSDSTKDFPFIKTNLKEVRLMKSLLKSDIKIRIWVTFDIVSFWSTSVEEGVKKATFSIMKKFGLNPKDFKYDLMEYYNRDYMDYESFLRHMMSDKDREERDESKKGMEDSLRAWDELTMGVDRKLPEWQRANRGG